MVIGRMRQRVTIEVNNQAQNTFGEMTNNWNTYMVVYAEVTPLIAVAREQVILGANQVQAKIPYQVRIRYQAGLSPALHRLQWKGKRLELEAVMDPDGHNHELLLNCFMVQR